MFAPGSSTVSLFGLFVFTFVLFLFPFWGTITGGPGGTGTRGASVTLDCPLTPL